MATQHAWVLVLGLGLALGCDGEDEGIPTRGNQDSPEAGTPAASTPSDDDEVSDDTDSQGDADGGAIDGEDSADDTADDDDDTDAPPMGDDTLGDDTADDDTETPPDDDTADDPPVSGLGNVGSPCEGIEDCRQELTCFNEDQPWIEGFVVPNGMCSLACDSDPFVCEGLGQNVTCVTWEGVGSFCQQLCPYGVSGVKCREDQACVPLTAEVGSCDPRCRDDSDCALGRSCDLASGFCTEQPLAGAAIGEPCMIDTDCEGLVCLFEGETATTGVCSARCTVLNYPAGCGYDPNSSEPLSALCDPIITFLVTGLVPAIGDSGFCALTCDDANDCAFSMDTCFAFDEETAELTGRTGVCVDSRVLEEEPPPDDMSMADAGTPTPSPSNTAPPASDASIP